MTAWNVYKQRQAEFVRGVTTDVFEPIGVFEHDYPNHHDGVQAIGDEWGAGTYLLVSVDPAYGNFDAHILDVVTEAPKYALRTEVTA